MNNLKKFLTSDDVSDKPFLENKMVVKKCDSWNKFKEYITTIDNLNKELLNHEDYELKCTGVPFFRGQSNASWELKTSLERIRVEYMNVFKYYALLSSIRKDIETCEIKNVPEFDVPKLFEAEDVKKILKNPTSIPYLEFLTFVRHLGFPSPLLDWSRSPYVAAFFAFRKSIEKSENVAIYMFIDKVCKGYISSKENDYKTTTITTVGSYVGTHKRHFLQQSEYTICVTRHDNELFEFAPYQKCLSGDFFSADSQIIFKIILPVSERTIALKELDKMNINAYSLFVNEEGLLETLFNRKVLFK